ncbi:glycosyltransferase family 4 protein [Candidatus Parcubacteria bacterium]|nr:glycosyltransferase family 4 protein [Patescibacteria group bacterium]MCG2689492.1 glycosyltransferase family 4 protein [Candidatus Parcubacteria bacterium]
MSFRIARIIYDWPKPWDGLAPAPYYLTKHQKLLGNSLTVFCGRWNKSGGPEKISGVSIISFPREPVEGVMLLTTAPLMSLYFLFWRVFNKVDIYHVHGHFGLYIYLYKFLFGWLDKTPLVAHFHNTTAGRIAITNGESVNKDGFFVKNIAILLSLISDKLAVKVARACIFVSKQNIDEAIKYYHVPREKCFLVESGVATEVFDNKIQKGDKKQILYVGALNSRKNVESLVASLQYLPDLYNLKIIGRGFESFVNKIKEIAKDTGVLERVIFEGYIENAHLPKYYAESAIFVIPSLYEGLPKVVLEALASGIPVLASGFSIKSPISGLFFIDNPTPRKIASNILKIVQSNVKVDSNYIEKYYSWKAKAQEIQKIYEHLVEN